MLSSGHDVADARLHRQVRAMCSAGLQVEVLGLGSAGDGPAGATVRTWPRTGGLDRACLAVRMARQARGRVLMTLDPDSALAAAALTRGGTRPGRPLVVDVHEDYAALLRDRAWARGLTGLAARALVAAFLQVAARASVTVVADDHVPPRAARRRLVLRNDPDLGLLPEPSATAALPDPPRAVYIGDLRASRGLFAMVEAVRRAPGWEADLVGPVAAADERQVLAVLAEDPGLAARVRLHGRMPPARAWELAGGAAAGLLLLADTPAFRAAQPSKLAEYLACGLPVVGTDLPRPAELIRRLGAGAVVPTGSDQQVGSAVAEVLSGWSSDPAGYAQCRARVEAAARALRSQPTGYHELARVVAQLR